MSFNPEFCSGKRSGKSKIRLAVCILHYGDPLLTAALHGQFLMAEPCYNFDIMVLDNAAPDPYPNAWKRLDENVYWPGAFAFALDELGRRGYTHLWFCNNDAELVSQAPYIERMETRLLWQEKFGPVGMVSPALTQNPYHGHMTHLDGKECVEVPYVDGVAPVVNIAAVSDVGGLDFEDNPYGYGVDVCLSLRLAQKGWRVLVDHAFVMRHRYHTTACSVSGFLEQAARYEEAYMVKRLGENWRDDLAKMREGWSL